MQNVLDFCDYLSHQKRYSIHTTKAYKKDLEQFELYLLDQFGVGSIEQVTAVMIRSWMVNLIERKISPRSINRKLSTLKSFYKFLIKKNIVKTTPLSTISGPKASMPLPVFVPDREMDRLFEELSFNEDFEGYRDQLVLELFYSTGIRLNELIELTTSSIDFSNQTIRVLGKRNKERIIPLTHNLVDLARSYMRFRAEINSSENRLFLTKKGKKFYPKLVYRMVNSYLEKATTLNKKSPHVLRHTFATHMLNNGAELNAIKEILGHANLSATQVYTHTTTEKLKNIHKQTHPKG